MKKLLYALAVLWILAFVWQTIAHAEAMPPIRLSHNGSSMTGVLDFDTGQISIVYEILRPGIAEERVVPGTPFLYLLRWVL